MRSIVFEGDTVNEYVGGYDDWLRQRKTAMPEPAATRAPATKTAPAAPAPPKKKRLSYKEQQELVTLPATI